MFNWFTNHIINSPQRLFIGGAAIFMSLGLNSFYHACTAETLTSLAVHSASAGSFFTSTFYYGLFIFQQKVNTYQKTETDKLKAQLKDLENDH